MNTQTDARKKRMLLILAILLPLLLLLGGILIAAIRSAGAHDLYSEALLVTIQDNPPPTAQTCAALLNLDTNGDGIPDYQEVASIVPQSEYDKTVLKHLTWIHDNINDITPDGVYTGNKYIQPKEDARDTDSSILPGAASSHPAGNNTVSSGSSMESSFPMDSSSADSQEDNQTNGGRPGEQLDTPSSDDSSSGASSAASQVSSEAVSSVESETEDTRPASPHILGIYIKQLPAHLDYVEGQRFLPDGMTVMARMSDGTEWEVTAYQYDTSPLTTDTKTVTIRLLANHGSYECSVAVTVARLQLVSLRGEWRAEREPGSYIEGQTFQPEDWAFTGRYNNGLESLVPSVQFPAGRLEMETTSISVSTGNGIGGSVSAELPIRVRKTLPERLTIDAPPTKTRYIEETTFQPDGLRVLLHYDNGVDSKEIIRYTWPEAELRLGQKNVRLTWSEAGVTLHAEVPITVAEKKITGAEITALPDKADYIEGECFNPDGLEITASYDNGKTEVYRGFTLCPDLVLEQTSVPVPIQCRGSETVVDVPVTVIRATPLELTVTAPPNKTEYIEETAFDSTGLKTSVRFDNGKTLPRECSFPTGEFTLADSAVTLSYSYNDTTVTTDVAVTIVPRKPLELLIDTPPTKTAYINGEAYDLSGLVCSARYDNGKLHTVSGVTAKAEAEMGDDSLLLHYTENGVEVTAAVPVTVRQEVLTNITLHTLPKQTEYVEGTQFEPEGIQVECSYDNGKTALLSDVDYADTEFALGEASKTVSVTHYGVTLSVEVPVTVRKAVPIALEVSAWPDSLTQPANSLLDLSGMELLVSYDNGKTKTIPATDSRVTLSNGKQNLDRIDPVSSFYWYPLGDCRFTEDGVTVNGTDDGSGKRMLITPYLAQPRLELSASVPYYKVGNKLGPTGLVVAFEYSGRNAATLRTVPCNPNNADDEVLKLIADGLLSLSYEEETATNEGAADKPLTITLTPSPRFMLATEATAQVKVAPLLPVSIEVSGAPAKTRYVNDEAFEPEGLELTATMNNGTTRILQPDSEGVSLGWTDGGGFHSMLPGTSILKYQNETNTARYTYNGKTVSAPLGLEIEDEIPVSLTRHGPDSSLSFIENTPFQPGDVSYTITLSNGKTLEVPYKVQTVANATPGQPTPSGGQGYNITAAPNPADKLVAGGNADYGENSAAFSFTMNGGTVSDSFPYTLEHRRVKSIQATAGKTYNHGDSISASDFDVTLTWNNGETSEAAAENITLSASKAVNTGLTQTTNTITVRAKDLLTVGSPSCAAAITVLAPVPTRLEVTKAPDQVQFINGTAWTPAGIQLKATYSNGATQTLSYNSAGVSYDRTVGAEIAYGTTSFTAKYTYNGTTVQATQTVKVILEVPTALQVTAAPTKTQFINGTAWTPAGIELKATLSNGKTTNLIYNSSGVTYDRTIGAEIAYGTTSFTAKYTYNGTTVQTTQAVTVIREVPTALQVTAAPTKTQFINGTAWTPAGIELKATLSNGKTTNLIYNSAGVSYNRTIGAEIAYGTTSFTAKYILNGTTVQAAQAVTVIREVPTALQVTAAPTKTAYIEANTLNLAGLQLKATLSNGKTTTLTYNSAGVSCSPAHGAALTTANKAVTITYTLNGTAKTATQAITVAQKSIKSITIKTKPTKTTYTDGETFNGAGLVLNATYDNGSTGTINTLANMVFSPTAMTNKGTTAITQAITVKTTGLRVVGTPSCTLNVTINPGICPTCKGSGKVTCSRCGGRGTTTSSCGSCGGSGSAKKSCSSCRGSGGITKTCSCGGDGKNDNGSTCGNCGGSGTVEWMCGTCDGSGKVTGSCSSCNGSGSKTRTCSTCSGAKTETCSTCGGTGKYSASKTFLAIIPKDGGCSDCVGESPETTDASIRVHIVDIGYRLPESDSSMEEALFIVTLEDGRRLAVPTSRVAIEYYDDRMRLIYRYQDEEVYHDYPIG